MVAVQPSFLVDTSTFVRRHGRPYRLRDVCDLKEYQLRGVIGEEWDEDDAVTLATNGPEAPREFTVNFGLTQPGTSIVLKVYVITEAGRERGSAAMRVDRV